MRKHLAGLAILALACAAPAFAQTTYTAPRTADGRPDFQGFWTNTSLTSLERSGQFKDLLIPADQAAKLEAGRLAANIRADAPTDPNSGAPKKGQDVGGYNNAYVDAGLHYATINGEKRSSWIVDPPNGKIPYTASGRKAFDDGLHFVRNTFDGPESRPMAERCLVGFGSTGGPPINVEMNHDARIIPLGDAKLDVYQWLGRSRGKWEGDTLVVETTNFHPGESLRTFFSASYLLSPDAKVTEKFTRISDSELLYEFTVNDPKLFSQPWRAEMIFNKSAQPAYEYACHEGNHALPGILAGARENEKVGLVNYAEESE